MAGVYRVRSDRLRSTKKRPDRERSDRQRPGSKVVMRRGARELRIDGTFASYWEPGRVATGSVWDAVAAPILALPPARRRSLLLLGLGGGSAARLARALAPRARVVGVEIDPEVVRLARRHFELDRLGLEVVVADARRYVARARGRFDVILEDIFVGAGRDVHKPDWLPLPGLATAASRLAPGGILVSNTLDETPAVARALRERFAGLLRIEIAGYDNRVLAAGPSGLSARRLRAAVAADPVLGATLPRLRFRTL